MSEITLLHARGGAVRLRRARRIDTGDGVVVIDCPPATGRRLREDVERRVQSLLRG